MTVVAVLETIVAELVPNFTEVGLARLAPVTVTCWPPEVGPELAMTPVTVGGDDAKTGGTPIHNIAVPVTVARNRAASLLAELRHGLPGRSRVRRGVDRAARRS